MTDEATRRGFLRGAGTAGLALGLGGASVSLGGAHAQDREAIRRHAIPATGERIPAIGMGTWITFNVGEDAAMRRARADVLARFLAEGGGMVDSSPMYGSSEAVVGDCLDRLEDTGGLFSATKVWTPVLTSGPDQMAESRRLWGLDRFDLMQVHNLVDWEEHLETLQQDKAEGRVRYIGVTTSHGRRHGELEEIMRGQPIDFVQLTYNIVDREAEDRLLPLAAERGIAVIANRPYRRKALIEAFQGKPLPDWAEAEAGARNWPEFLLKFIIGHPALTCAIPATTRVEHMAENMGALHGPLPDARTRARMAAYVEAL
ncbi:aldo/keto reductase [Marivibrio halodurans]|uniref:Aldo/keto reductase n=2 Tax=Marivibrio halodurans TaxID=2039722 RepID=A0A8J7V1Z7_9PROT|nr:aldo/keto reductase [Marivibrio halodurans]